MWYRFQISECLGEVGAYDPSSLGEVGTYPSMYNIFPGPPVALPKAASTANRMTQCYVAILVLLDVYLTDHQISSVEVASQTLKVVKLKQVLTK